jgi:hypothetical protein
MSSVKTSPSSVHTFACVVRRTLVFDSDHSCVHGVLNMTADDLIAIYTEENPETEMLSIDDFPAGD